MLFSLTRVKVYGCVRVEPRMRGTEKEAVIHALYQYLVCNTLAIDRTLCGVNCGVDCRHLDRIGNRPNNVVEEHKPKQTVRLSNDLTLYVYTYN